MKLYIVCCLFVHNIVFELEARPNEFDKVHLSFIVHRHGDRTPDPDEIVLAEDPELIEELSYPDGATGLTTEGKRRGYQLGKLLRQRYGNGGQGLLSDLYIEEEIAIKSTDLPRTKMTILTVLAGLYPPPDDQQWSRDLGVLWQPIPYNAVPSPSDYLRFTANCDRYKALLAEGNRLSSTKEFLNFDDLNELLMNNTRHDFKNNPLLYATLHDLFHSEAVIGMKTPKWAVPHISRLNMAAKLAYDLFMRNEEMKKLATGVILNDFLNSSRQIISGENVTQRLRIFTSHDYNVGALMSVAGVKLNSIPDYCSMFALELHQNKISGAYYVLPVYLRKAGESEPVAMTIDGCSEHCPFEQFQKLTEKYAITEEQYFDSCKN